MHTMERLVKVRLNHEGHEEHEESRVVAFVDFVSFVVQVRVQAAFEF